MLFRRNLNASSKRAAAAKRITREPAMTRAQAAELRSLAEEAGEPDAFEEGIGRTEAAHRINALRAKVLHDRFKF